MDVSDVTDFFHGVFEHVFMLLFMYIVDFADGIVSVVVNRGQSLTQTST